MQLRLVIRDPALAAESLRRIEQRARLVLGRHTPRVERARLTLTREPLRSGGSGFRGRLYVRLRDGATAVEEDRHPDPVEAAACAARRMEQRLDRSRDPARPRPPATLATGVH